MNIAEYYQKILLHRGGGFGPKEIRDDGMHEENSAPRIAETLPFVHSMEVDIVFDKYGVAWCLHHNISNLSTEEVRNKYPYHFTLESLVAWYKTEELKDKHLYLDLKTGAQDEFRLAQYLQPLGERATLGSRDPSVVFKLMLAKKLLGGNFKIFQQVPIVLSPEKAVAYLQTIPSHVNALQYKEEASELGIDLDKLIPDGIHIFYPDGILRGIVAELFARHGKVIPRSHIKSMKKGYIRVPQWQFLTKIREKNIKKLIKLMGEKNLKTMIGATASKETMEKMLIEFEADFVMIDLPKDMIESFGANKESLALPKNISIHDQNCELTGKKTTTGKKEEKRDAYEKLTQNLRATSLTLRTFGATLLPKKNK